MAADPSQGIHGELLPHVHLLSTYRYATTARVDIGEVTKLLMHAPKIARDGAAFYWTFIDAPPDGSVFLTWQPLQRRGTEFATDGYFWPGPEQVYRQQVGNGLILEMLVHKSGFRPGEQFTFHARKRFHLIPASQPPPNTPQPDPSLWIVHYSQAENQDRIPINLVTVTQQMQQVMMHRQQLQSFGQITRKEFMLADRGNWPNIGLPGRGQSMYPPSANARPVPPQMAYPPHGQPVGPMSKQRGRGHAQAQAAAAAAAAGQGQQPMMGAQSLDSALDDDEDTFRGDVFDHLTPREVSITRYQQNHEWMEEVLSSPYRIGQIAAADLGLGVKGELAPLTRGIFEAPGADALDTYPKDPYVGRLDGKLAEEFRKRVDEKIEASKAEIERIKEQHEKTLAKFKAGSILLQAEQELRAAVEEGGNEIWRLEGRQDESDESVTAASKEKKTEDIVADIESFLGKKTAVFYNVHRVQDGGYQEPEPEPEPEPVVVKPAEPTPGPSAPVPGAADTSMSRQPSHAGSQASGIMIGDSDIDMGGTAAGLLDQMHNTDGFSSTSTPVNSFPTPQPQLSAIASNTGTPVNLGVPSPAPAPVAASEVPPPQPTGEDVKMEDAEPSKPALAAPEQGAADDWVVVPKGGVSPMASGEGAAPEPSAATAVAAASPAAPAPATAAAVAPSSSDDVPKPAEPAPAPAPTVAAAAAVVTAPSSKPASAAPTPGDNSAAGFDNNDFSSLGDLDTAGDALAGYDDDDAPVPGDAIDLDMEDSAFGDAFHGVEHSGEGGAETPADGGL